MNNGIPPAGDVQILSFVRLMKGAAILTDGHPAKYSLETKKQNLSMCINYEYIVGLQQLKSR